MTVRRLDSLSTAERLQLLRFVASFAWADLEVVPEERAFVRRLVKRLRLSPEEMRQVDGWLETPPDPDDIDPTTIPHAHRALFLDAVRDVIAADGKTAPEERENLGLLEQLTR
jgi:uncharacterized tellurite resistance protein B-like protein